MKKERDALSPADVQRILEQGNERFRQGNMSERDMLERVSATADGQWPGAVILGCIDSRVSAELVFDQGIGDVFNIRLAGNVLNDDALGSLEFSCQTLGAKLVVVLGHTRCMAIKAACDGVELGHIAGLLARIRPALDAVSGSRNASQSASANAEFVEEVGRTNVRLTVDAIPERSEILREMQNAGEIAIVGAVYDVADGAVEFLPDP